jgi:hypothetical protein
MPKINVLSGLHKVNATRIQSTCWSIAESLVHRAFRCMPEMCRKLLPTQRHDKKSCSDCTKHKNIYTMRRIEMWTHYGNATTNTPNAPFGGPTESAPVIQPLWRQNVVPLVKHATKSCPRIELLSNACKLNRLRDLFPRVNQDLFQQQGFCVGQVDANQQVCNRISVIASLDCRVSLRASSWCRFVCCCRLF